jgi:membrane-associated HD superfamily phosphohydrolase
MKTAVKNKLPDEEQSLRTIREMIQVSRNKLKNDGILFIVWGWIFLINYLFLNYLPGKFLLSHKMMDLVHSLRVILPVSGLIFTLYYILKQRKKVQTYIGISLRYVWISLFASMVLVNLIQMNVLHRVNFELQHPIFMVLIAFAVTVTGGILRYRLIIAGGIIFGLLALAASYFELQTQLLLEAIAWIIAFIIPGHLLYAKRNKK